MECIPSTFLPSCCSEVGGHCCKSSTPLGSQLLCTAEICFVAVIDMCARRNMQQQHDGACSVKGERGKRGLPVQEGAHDGVLGGSGDKEG